MVTSNGFLVTVQYFTAEEPTQVLVDGLSELAQVITLMSKSDRYELLTVEAVGEIHPGRTLIEDLIDENKPEDMQFGN